MICTFFGHRNIPKEVSLELRRILVDLIERKGVTEFLVGNQGSFDSMVKHELRSLKVTYPIRYAIVLAYLANADSLPEEEADDTVFPEGIECVPKRFAIDFRNKWMVKKSDYVVTCVKHSFGGAAKFKEYAERKNKTVINITF